MDLIIPLYVKPNAKEDKIIGIFQNHIKIFITAPAQENKANVHIQKWLAKQFKVPQSQVILEKGHLSRYKVFRIVEPRVIPEPLVTLLASL